MANRHLKELLNKTKIYFEELNELDSRAVRVSSVTMVDPEEWGELIGNIRTLSLHLSNINSLLTMALDPNDFTSALKSRRSLVSSLSSTVERVKVEQPDSFLIAGYEKALKEHKNLLVLLEETSRFRSFPKSKKKFNQWSKKGLIDLTYLPFEDLDKKLLVIKNQIEAEV